MLFESDREKKQKLIIVGVVYNNNNQLLLQRRCEYNNPDAHMKWELPGGKIEFGEPPQLSIEREILEETGYIVKAESIIPNIHSNIWTYEDCFLHAIIIGFNCRLIKQCENYQQDHRVFEFKWFDLKEIYSLDLLLGVKDIIDYSKLVKDGKK